MSIISGLLDDPGLLISLHFSKACNSLIYLFVCLFMFNEELAVYALIPKYRVILPHLSKKFFLFRSSLSQLF